jgi:copper transporter 1
MFAGSCIGVICLVICLEFLRRLGKEYDRYLVREYRSQKASRRRTSDASEEPVNGYSSAGDSKHIQQCHARAETSPDIDANSAGSWNSFLIARSCKPNIKQQFIQAFLHMLQFGVAYFIMLLAMYYSGYIIICILIDAFLGAMVFSCDVLGNDQSPQGDSKVCCG